MSAFGDWLFTCDRAATAESYSQTTAGGAETCGSGGCRNFLLVRDQVFPPAFVDLLRSLALIPTKTARFTTTLSWRLGGTTMRGGSILSVRLIARAIFLW
jgi:hypothetical protein